MAKFSAKGKSDATSSAHDAKDLANIAPMLFLQEVDEYKLDQEQLEEFADKAFKSLKKLQLALISGRLDEGVLLSLEKSLEKKHQFTTPELKSLVEEIEIRVAVEIAKLEHLSTKNTES